MPGIVVAGESEGILPPGCAVFNLFASFDLLASCNPVGPPTSGELPA